MMDFGRTSWKVVKSVYCGRTDCKEYGRDSMGWPGTVGELAWGEGCFSNCTLSGVWYWAPWLYSQDRIPIIEIIHILSKSKVIFGIRERQMFCFKV